MSQMHDSTGKYKESTHEKGSFHLAEWHIVVTPRAIIVTLFSFGLIFFVFGLCYKLLSKNLVTYEFRYDDICKNNPDCQINIQINHELKGNIVMLYKLYNFYQNHRRIQGSRNYGQLKGKYIPPKELSSCDPAISSDKTLNPDKIYLPCGLMALSFFNDTYYFVNSSVANFSDMKIAIDSDRKELFAPLNDKYKEGIRYLQDYVHFPNEQTNEHFIVWMRTAAMPKFLKVYAKCEDCIIPVGNYTIQVSMQYPETQYKGIRSIVLTTTGGLGSGSDFIAYAYLGVGVFAFLFATGFLIQVLVCPRPFGDLSLLWEDNNRLSRVSTVNNLDQTNAELLPHHDSLRRNAAHSARITARRSTCSSDEDIELDEGDDSTSHPQTPGVNT